MSTLQSFTALENELLPKLRRDLEYVENIDDIQKFFTYNARHLLFQVLAGEVPLNPDEIKFTPQAEPYFQLGSSITGSAYFQSVWGNSNLPTIVRHLAEATRERYKYLVLKM